MWYMRTINIAGVLIRAAAVQKLEYLLRRMDSTIYASPSPYHSCTPINKSVAENQRENDAEVDWNLKSTSGDACVVDLTEKNLLEVIQKCKRDLLLGKIIALPTDTIYGIAGLAQNTSAVRSIYSIKDRDASKPVAICVGQVSDIHRWAVYDVPDDLLKSLLPGPVTLVFKRTEQLNLQLNPGTELIGIRIPEHEFVKNLVQECGQPIALTSANRSGLPSCLQIHVTNPNTMFDEGKEFSDLWPNLSLVVNGGRLGNDTSADLARLGSTVVNLSISGKYSVIRPGRALASTIEKLQSFGLKELIQSSTSCT